MNNKGKVVTLNIIQKATLAIKNLIQSSKIKEELDFIVPAQSVLFEEYEHKINTLNDIYEKHESVLKQMSELYIDAERLRRIIFPKVYVNVYLEKRNNTHLYINANCGYVNAKGKVENVIVYMGKSAETDVQVAQSKIDADCDFQEKAKKAIVLKLINKRLKEKLEL